MSEKGIRQSDFLKHFNPQRVSLFEITTFQEGGVRLGSFQLFLFLF